MDVPTGLDYLLSDRDDFLHTFFIYFHSLFLSHSLTFFLPRAPRIVSFHLDAFYLFHTLYERKKCGGGVDVNHDVLNNLLLSGVISCVLCTLHQQ